MRGRNRNGSKGPNPLTRSYESNGPDVKIRGTAQHIAEKYSQLARDATASGDPVAAENYFQHAEHYFRIIAAAQEQLREQYGYQRPFDEEGDDEGFSPNDRQAYGNGDDMDPGSQPQPFEARGEGERERPSRFDRGERQDRDRQDRDRQDRGERQERNDRPERSERPERQDRGERRERFQRDRSPRQDFPRDDQPRLEFDRSERPERQDRNDRPERSERPERAERQERNGRAPFRRDRQRDEAETQDAGGLPAFLTNPVRSPVVEEPVETAAAVPAPQDAAGEEERPRRRTRRPRRSAVEEAGSENAAGFENVETPAAE